MEIIWTIDFLGTSWRACCDACAGYYNQRTHEYTRTNNRNNAGQREHDTSDADTVISMTRRMSSVNDEISTVSLRSSDFHLTQFCMILFQEITPKLVPERPCRIPVPTLPGSIEGLYVTMSPINSSQLHACNFIQRVNWTDEKKTELDLKVSKFNQNY
jgi:hypothetical protein